MSELGCAIGGNSHIATADLALTYVGIFLLLSCWKEESLYCASLMLQEALEKRPSYYPCCAAGAAEPNLLVLLLAQSAATSSQHSSSSCGQSQACCVSSSHCCSSRVCSVASTVCYQCWEGGLRCGSCRLGWARAQRLRMLWGCSLQRVESWGGCNRGELKAA